MQCGRMVSGTISISDIMRPDEATAQAPVNLVVMCAGGVCTDRHRCFASCCYTSATVPGNIEAIIPVFKYLHEIFTSVATLGVRGGCVVSGDGLWVTVRRTQAESPYTIIDGTVDKNKELVVNSAAAAVLTAVGCVCLDGYCTARWGLSCGTRSCADMHPPLTVATLNSIWTTPVTTMSKLWPGGPPRTLGSSRQS